jgi:uncharacterized protein YebE (UPF0316 family)
MSNVINRFLLVAISILIVVVLITKWQMMTEIGYDTQRQETAKVITATTAIDAEKSKTMLGSEVRNWIRYNVDSEKYTIEVKARDKERAEVVRSFDDVKQYDSEVFVNAASTYSYNVIDGVGKSTVVFTEEVM